MVTEVRPRPPLSARTRGTVLILVAALFFSSSGALGKPAMVAGMSPQEVAAARIGLAALVLLLGVAVVRPSLLRVRRGEWRLIVGYGLVGVAGVQLCYFVSASRIPVGIAILLEFTSPILIALWVRFVRRVRLPRVLWAGTVVAMIGLAMVAQAWEGLRLDLIGVLAGVGAAICSAGYFLLGEKAVSDMHPLGLVTWGMVVGAVAVGVVAPPWTLPTELFTSPAQFGPWQPPVWLLLVAVAILSTVIAYFAGISSLKHLPAPVASVLGLCEPLLAAGLAWLLLGEALTWIQLLGAAILLGGALIVQLNSPEKTPVGATLPEPRP